jgi:hypothetical protein
VASSCPEAIRKSTEWKSTGSAVVRLRDAFSFFTRHVLIVSWVLVSSAVYAQEPESIDESERHDSGWEIYLDNDAFSLLPLDQDYTGGLAVTLYGKRVTQYPFSLESIRDKIDQWSGSDWRYRSKKTFELHSFGFGYAAFTPKNTSASTPVYDDRPYASLVYIANTQQTVAYEENQVFQSTLMLGVLGLGVAEFIQNTVHSALGQGTANGWHNQISNGGEPTFRYTLARQVTHKKRYVKNGIDYELKSTADVSVGYITDVSLGLGTRFGDIRSPWWSFNPHQFDYSNMGIPTCRTGCSIRVEELFFWGGMDLRYRFYNALLQGQFRESTVTYSASEMNPWIAEAWGGVTKRFQNGYKFSFVLRASTPELRVGEPRNPVWAGIIVGRSF